MPRPTLYDHPKFHRLVFTLGLPEPYVVGLLEYLWKSGYASGNPVIGDEIDVELVSKWPGDRGVFFAAVLACGFIESADCNAERNAGNADGNGSNAGNAAATQSNKYQIHDLFDHAPEYVKTRRDRESERTIERACDWCEGDFRSGDSKARFCSSNCRVAAYKANKAEQTRRAEAMATQKATLATRRATAGNAGNGTLTPSPTLNSINTSGAEISEGAPKGLPRPSEAPRQTDGVNPPVNPLPPERDNPESVLRKSTLESFGQWSHQSRGYGLDIGANEHRKILDLLTAAAQEPPIMQGSVLTPRENLVALAASYAKRDRKEFKTVGYAVAIVKAELDRWARDGMPGTKPVDGALPPRRKIPTQQIYAS